MCFASCFKSERILCHARLPAALSSIHMPRDGGGWWVYACAPHQERTDQTRQGVAVAGVDAPPVKGQPVARLTPI